MIVTLVIQIAFTILILNFQVPTYTYLVFNLIHSSSYQKYFKIQT